MGYPYIPGTARFNGGVRPGTQSLSLGMDVYTVTTGVNITPRAVGTFADLIVNTSLPPGGTDYASPTGFVAGTIPNDPSQDALDRLVEIISQRGQPVVMGIPVAATGLATAAGPGNVPPAGTAGTGFTFRFMIEHSSAWGVTPMATPGQVPLLVAAIQAGGIDFGFNTDLALACSVASS